MMNDLSDEELQRLLEADDSSCRQPFTSQPMNDELAAYQHLFTALQQPPPGALPPNFSTNVVKHIQAHQRRSANRRFYMALSALFLVGLGLSFIGLTFIDHQVSRLMLQTLYQTKSWLLFGLGCLLVVQLLDHHLIKKRLAWLP